MPSKTKITSLGSPLRGNDELRIKEKKTSKIVIASKAKQPSLTVDVFDIKGGKTTMMLPSAVFGVKSNKQLLAQAVRVYLANQRSGTAKTKTRGEVAGSTRKIYQQKGTGRARHGGIRAPIFVGGGVVSGPRPHDFSLSMPKKMKKQALFCALSSKKIENGIVVIKGLEDIKAKTKEMIGVLQKIGLFDQKQVLLVVSPHAEKIANVMRATRNIEYVTLMSVAQLNTYEVLKSKTILFMQDAIESLASFVKEK